MSFPNRIRYFNKQVLNKAMIKIAGRSYSPIAIVHHTGRRSGKSFETPVIAEPVADGFLFALTYGSQVDWYRNVQAAGRCTLRWHGKNYLLEKPEPLESEAALPAYPLPFRLILKIMAIRHFFRMDVAES